MPSTRFYPEDGLRLEILPLSGQDNRGLAWTNSSLCVIIALYYMNWGV